MNGDQDVVTFRLRFLNGSCRVWVGYRWWALIVLVAIGVRVLYWWSVHHLPWFQAPGMDPEYYTDWAEDILEGRGGKYLPFPRGPLYPYLLAGMIGLSDHWLLPRLFNLLCDLGSISLIARIARRWVGERGALWAGGVYALCGMAIYFTGEILGTSLEIFLATLCLNLALSISSRHLLSFCSLGFTLGLFVLVRPTGMVWVPVLLGWVLYRWVKAKAGVEERKALARGVVGLIGSFLLVLTPVTLINYVHSGAFIPVSTLGGVNFYIGNHPASHGFSSFFPGVGAGWSDEEAKAFAEKEAGRKLNAGEVSQEFVKLTFRQIRRDPLSWLGLMGRKLFYLISFQEIGNNRPLPIVWEAVPWLRVLAGIGGIGFLLPLALVGFLHLKERNSPDVFLLVVLLASYSIALIAFFIASRYRMPLIPPVIILAVAGGIHLVKSWRERIVRRRLLRIVSLGWVLTLPPWLKAEGHPAQAPYVMANAYLRLGRPEEALPYYLRAAELDPYFLRLPLNLGVAYLELGDTAKAESLFSIAQRFPDMRGDALNNRGTILEGRGDRDSALTLYRLAYQIAPDNRDIRWNLARLVMIEGDTLALRGELEAAEVKYREALEILPDDPLPYYRLGVLAWGRGDLAEARRQALFLTKRWRRFKEGWELLRVVERLSR